MKRSNSKELNILTFVIVTMLAFLCIFNITYSYFTASAILNGNSNFGNIKVNFYYTTASGNAIVEDNATTADTDESTLVVNPVGTVRRGTPFNIQYNSAQLTGVGFKADTSSCGVYVRFWIDAYLLDDNGDPDTSENYGIYFSFVYDNKVAVENTERVDNELTYDETNITYFCPSAIASGGNYIAFDQLVLLDTAPQEMMGGTIRITIKFEAIQSTNGACQSWAMYDENDDLNDNKGISMRWS